MERIIQLVKKRKIQSVVYYVVVLKRQWQCSPPRGVTPAVSLNMEKSAGSRPPAEKGRAHQIPSARRGVFSATPSLPTLIVTSLLLPCCARTYMSSHH